MSNLHSSERQPDEILEVDAREGSQERQSNISLKDEAIGQSLVSPDNILHLYGQHENQVSEGGEADLHKHLAGCTKNPGHTKFKPINKFTVQDMPAGFQDDDLYDMMKVTADLAVRIEVKMTSPNRPEFWPGTTEPYPMYGMRSRTNLRYGTGKVTARQITDGVALDTGGRDVNFDGLKYESGSSATCPCTECKLSGNPSSVWWEIIVITATHVVFDEIEAKQTTCTLFYDEEGDKGVRLENFRADYVNVEGDTCMLKSVTCDPLGERLYGMAVRRWGLGRMLLEKYKNRSDIRWNFIVSHPHGCHKQVTFGELTSIHTISPHNDKFDMKKLVYKTATCPGSSGAPVICMGSYHGHVHSGALDSELNLSGVDLYFK